MQTPRLSFRLQTAEVIKNCLEQAMITQDEGPGSSKGNNILVVDDFSLSVLNAAVSQNDILKAGFICKLICIIIKNHHHYLDQCVYRKNYN